MTDVLLFMMIIIEIQHSFFYFFSQVVIRCAQFLFTSLVVQVPQNLAQAVSLRNFPRWIPEYVMSFFVPVFEPFFVFLLLGACGLGMSLLCVYCPWILQFSRYPIPPSLAPNIFSGFGLPGDNPKLEP
jgi:hypothetical protein